MRIGIPKEIKDHEYRVGITPAGVSALAARGHTVLVETSAGARIGFSDAMYEAAGAMIAGQHEIYGSDMVVKVKEPQPSEVALLREGQILFCYLHLAPEPELTRGLLERKVIGIAYETVTDAQGRLPLLIPMSEVAGRLAVQAGATALQIANGGSGVLLGGVPGVAPGKVVILGGGIAGLNAAKMAFGLGAEVSVLDIDPARLRHLDDVFGMRVKTRFSEPAAIAELVREADLVIGAVLIPGKRAPQLLTRAMVKTMKPGSALVDIAIDQGGCAETSRPTTHSAPTYVEHGVVHYCVTNMPGAAARTATLALTQATLPLVLELADKGWARALQDNPGLQDGLNVMRGQVTHPAVATDLGYAVEPVQTALAA
jgi:alanine dehydrogenase